MKRAGIILDRRVGGLGARQREQLLAEFPAGEPPTALMPSPLPQGRGSRERYLRAISQQAIARSPGCHRPPVAPSLLRPAGRLQGHQKAR